MKSTHRLHFPTAVLRALAACWLLSAGIAAVVAQPRECPVVGNRSFRPQSAMTLWYLQPARAYDSRNAWMEYALPIGNGHLGAMLYGGVVEDEIQFNEKTLWSGRATDNGASYGDYQNFGSLKVEDISGRFEGDTGDFVRNYVRSLDLTTGLSRVDYECNSDNVAFGRDYFVSRDFNVIVASYMGSGPDNVSVRVRLEPGVGGLAGPVVYDDRGGHFEGSLETVAYYAGFRLYTVGGTTRATSGGVEVRNARRVVVCLTGLTNFRADAPGQTSPASQLPDSAQAILAHATAKGIATIFDDHGSHMLPKVNSSILKLGDYRNDLPTDQLVEAYNRPGADPAYQRMLEMLYYTYGRYLAFSSSDVVPLPSNLQGIWNHLPSAPWHSDIHANINVQMNYWPCETTGLSLTHMPLLDYIIRMAGPDSPWQANAREVGQSRGWTCFTENNIFGGSGPFMHQYVVTNAWLCMHLWQHYLYTLDREFLVRAYPAMLSAAQFWMDRLKLDPSDGTYVCPDEYSPEHGPTEDGVAHAQQLVSALLDQVAEATKVLGREAPIGKADKKRLEFLRKHIDRGLHTETYTGTFGTDKVAIGAPLLREWKQSAYDNAQAQPQHRHLSHLMALYPLGQITPASPYFEAAINSLRLRGDESTGWSMGWKINLWARALDGNHAHRILRRALRHATSYDCDANGGGIYYNLFDAHAPFQIDGNMGASAGIAEMLLQSYDGTAHLLPALPDAWPSGRVTGLVAQGGCRIDLTWKQGRLIEAAFQSYLSNRQRFVAPAGSDVRIYDNGSGATLRRIADNLYEVTMVDEQPAVVLF